mmetsp:Transcript_36502/g.112937  ORF Transcript_36502/g.112937 Transcript_36502/m.112937 type:complete len:557 (-) Transcript_36502:69-1739(-)
MRVAIALSLAIAARAAFPSRGRDPRQNKASAEQRKRAEREYYAPYKFYGRPLHLLTDVEWGNFERRSRKPRACALPADQGVSFYLFSFLRDDSPGLLAHFLRWYKAAGLDFETHARFVLHGNASFPADSNAARTAQVFQDYGVPAAAVKRISQYSSSIKVAEVNAYIETLPADAWLVYPDLEEFFAYPCHWGGRVLPLVDHMARQSVDGPMAASIVADTSRPEFAWLRQLAATTPHYRDAPWHPSRAKKVDFVGGEMYDRVARSWALEEVVPPPPPNTVGRWTDADVGARSLFHQFPHSLRATGCLLHARPFKHALTAVGCRLEDGTFGNWRQRFENSHLTGCYAKEGGEWVKQIKTPVMHETPLAFAHFRFTSNATAALREKRSAYEAAAADWRATQGDPTSAADKLALANLNHAQKTYRAQQLLFERLGDKLAFRDEVQLVLLLDCNEDRPLPLLDPRTGVRPPMLYGPQTSGRLPDLKRRALLGLLATDDPDKARKLATALFTVYYPEAKNLTKSTPLNKRLASYQLTGARRGDALAQRKRRDDKRNARNGGF